MSKTTKAVAKKQVKTKASTKKGTAKKSISTSYVYAFGKKTDGNATMRDLLGGKGANLAEMASIGLPVPPGFTISTEVCGYYYDNGKTYPASLSKSILKAIKQIETQLGKSFGGRSNPLLVSVRSGARDSMPGMMDTILNLGLNDVTVEGLAEISGNPRFAWDCYRRFIQMYGDVVMGVQARSEEEEDPFHEILEKMKRKLKVETDSDLSTENLKALVDQYKALIRKRTRSAFPQDVFEQLWGATSAVFSSWRNERAILYRQQYAIPAEWGTAVNIQAMVFGNMGNDCSTGVAFTRNPSTGDNSFFGEFLINAQGEDVVAGTRTPQYITKKAKQDAGSKDQSMEEAMPKVYKELAKVFIKLEKHYKDMQDIEFTVENNKLWMLQTRSGKRTAKAAIKIAVDMVKEKLINKDKALTRIPAQQLEALLHRTMDESKIKDFKKLAKGIAASPGAASGIVVFDVKKAIELGDSGKKVILVRKETKPEDVPAFFSSEGILTSLGGKSSHAAIVSRGMGKPCIVGCPELKIDYDKNIGMANGMTIKEGDTITIDGSEGTVFIGQIPTIEPKVTKDFEQILDWSQKIKTLDIRANADTPDGAVLARKFGAKGIGLCRTERMFNGSDRINLFVEMIMAENIEERSKILKN